MRLCLYAFHTESVKQACPTLNLGQSMDSWQGDIRMKMLRAANSAEPCQNAQACRLAKLNSGAMEVSATSVSAVSFKKPWGIDLGSICSKMSKHMQIQLQSTLVTKSACLCR